MLRQGDILIVPVTDLPEKRNEIPRENGRVVLAHGEVTGHTHSIVEPNAKLYEIPGDTVGRVLWLPNGGIVEHEEHGPIELPPGNYQIIRQREYTPLGERKVLD